MEKDRRTVSIETTEDRLLGGRVRVRQPAKGYRAGMDAALLAAALDLSPEERVLEVGCGVGGALIQAAFRESATRFVGLERDAAAVALARENVASNGLCDRVAIQSGQVARGAIGVKLLASRRR